jgi:transposase InsO family protein
MPLLSQIRAVTQRVICKGYFCASPNVGTIKEEEVDLSEYENFGDALRRLGRVLDDVSKRKRIHASLGYLTPAEFEGQWREKHSARA